MSSNQTTFDVGSAYLRNLGSGTSPGGADAYPGDAGPGSIGVVVGSDLFECTRRPLGDCDRWILT